MGRGGNLPPKGRTWVIEADPTTGIVDEDQVAQAIAEAALIVDRLGGVVQIAAHREEIPEEFYGIAGMFATRGLMVKWESYAPAAKRPRTENGQQPAEEPVEAPAG